MLRRFVLVILFFLPPAAQADLAVLDRWIAQQAEIRTLSAEFTQTRSLRVLRHPVSADGRIWFAAPEDFRWQVGEPPRTIILRRGEDIRVVEPGKKRVRTGAFEVGRREAGMLDFPPVKSRSELERRYVISDFQIEDGRATLRLQPRGGDDFLAGLVLVFVVGAGHLESLEMTFRDGSTLRNSFRNVEVNRPLPPGTFVVDVTDYQVGDASR
jgi:outer membrane lipoprotein-sorting protein